MSPLRPALREVESAGRRDHSICMPGGASGVLLIHGLGGTPLEMRHAAKALNAAGHTVVCCQLAGHCGTEDDLIATGWRDWYASAEAALRDLQRTCETVVVGGLSMGALLALHLAAAHGSAIAGSVVFGPTLVYDGWSIPRYSFLLKLLVWLPFGRDYRFVEQYPYGVKDKRVRTAIRTLLSQRDSSQAGLAATPARALRELWRLAAALKPKLGEIESPVLIVHAREDDICSLKNAFLLQKALGGLVETHVLDDSYHLVTIDRQRDIAIARALRFIDELAGTRRSSGRSATAQ